MYNAAKKGNNSCLDEHLKREEENGYQVTPNGNTILHVAAHFGQHGFVGEVLKVTPGLLCNMNKKNETALHIAANIGQSEVVSKLLSVGGGGTTLVQMTDDTGDTALHKAVRGGHLEIVKMLVKLLVDPELDFPANKAGETPLYLAAEFGFHDVLTEICNSCKDPTCVAGPFKRTPLHAAVIQEHKECARSLWQWNNHLCEEADEWGWNSLHYAVKQGLKDLVSDMLERKKSLAYIPAGSENDWTTAFHIAASEGDVAMIKELLKHCPDCCDMVNSKGQNALHVAILNHQEKSVHELLVLMACLVDEADNEGNTPLHLLAACSKRLPEILLEDARAKKMSFNKQNQTPLDIALSRTWTVSKEKLVTDLWRINGRLGKRDFKINRKMETKKKIEMMRVEEEEKVEEKEKAKREKIEIENIMKATQTPLVVATLIMTVTFTAGFTLPGGVETDDGPNKGTAILLKKPAFHAFFCSNVMAFVFSACAIFIYAFISAASSDVRIDFVILILARLKFYGGFML